MVIIETLRPNASGAEEALTDVGGTGGEPDNWSCVDEITPDGDTTSVYTPTYDTWFRDLYNLPAPTGQGTIISITLYFRVHGDSTDCIVKGVIRSDSTITESGEYVPFTDFGSGTYGTYSREWVLNPADGEVWEWSDIADLQIGISMIRPDYGVSHCTQVYVVVDSFVPTVTIIQGL